jgi:diguanylate cyclase (GGDEF)-like protein/PAS domain S-box-containing protein
VPDNPFGEELHKSIVDNIADGVYYVEPDRTIKYWNRGAERIAGYPAAEIVGHRCYDNILAHVDGQGNSLCHSACPLAASMSDGEPRDLIIWLRHREGYRKPVHIRTAPVRDDAGNIVGGVEVFSDASATVRATEDADRARRDALTDELTGLPNRRMFDAALRGRLENLGRYGWQFGLLLVDIDHFKVVNDEHGHAFGDAVLTGIAVTLQGAVRAGDLVARWGGEEFAVLVEASDAESLLETAERVRVLVAQSEVRQAGVALTVYVSVGCTLAAQEDTPESLFARADAALYAAKNGGRNRIELVDRAGREAGRASEAGLPAVEPRSLAQNPSPETGEGPFHAQDLVSPQGFEP